MATRKKRTMNELRQTKDTAYTPPLSHAKTDREDFQNSDESVEDFVNSII